MMIGEPTRSHPTVQVPPWDHYDDPMAGMTSPFPVSGVSVNFSSNATSPGSGDYSPFISEALSALQRYLPSNEYAADDSDFAGDEFDLPFDSFSCDNFRMYEFKVRRCARGRSHDWTECPYAHPGEKARRRDPRKYGYSGTACPDFRKGACKKGDACEFAHGVFECWLHPDRYRTQPCKDGTNCRRRVCFFAHEPEQLRVLTTAAATQQSPRSSHHLDGTPNTVRRSFDSYLSNGSFGSSHASIMLSPPGSPPSDSPPMSPNSPSLCGSFNSVSELVANMRNLQVGQAMSQLGSGFSGFGSTRCSNLRPGFCSLPTTPTRIPTRPGLGVFDLWENKACEEEPAMERVESGRDLRAKIYAKLSKENSFGRVDSGSSAPDVGWVSELVK